MITSNIPAAKLPRFELLWTAACGGGGRTDFV